MGWREAVVERLCGDRLEPLAACLQSLGLPPGADRGRTVRWLAQNPHGSALVVRFKDEPLDAGLLIALPRRFCVEGCPVMAIDPVTLFVPPRRRTLGPVLHLQRALEWAAMAQGAGFLLATPPVGAGAVYRRRGFRCLGDLRRWTWAIEPGLKGGAAVEVAPGEVLAAASGASSGAEAIVCYAWDRNVLRWRFDFGASGIFWVVCQGIDGKQWAVVRAVRRVGIVEAYGGDDREAGSGWSREAMAALYRWAASRHLARLVFYALDGSVVACHYRRWQLRPQDATRSLWVKPLKQDRTDVLLDPSRWQFDRALCGAVL